MVYNHIVHSLQKMVVNASQHAANLFEEIDVLSIDFYDALYLQVSGKAEEGSHKASQCECKVDSLK